MQNKVLKEFHAKTSCCSIKLSFFICGAWLVAVLSWGAGLSQRYSWLYMIGHKKCACGVQLVLCPVNPRPRESNIPHWPRPLSLGGNLEAYFEWGKLQLVRLVNMGGALVEGNLWIQPLKKYITINCYNKYTYSSTKYELISRYFFVTKHFYYK